MSGHRSAQSAAHQAEKGTECEAGSFDTPDLASFRERIDPALLPEWMDQSCSYAEFRSCVRDIAATTRITLAYRPTLAFLARAAKKITAGRPMRVVDVGSGGGDTLLRVARWAQRCRQPVQLTGIDLNPHATAAATEAAARAHLASPVEWITGDALSEPRTQQPDVVISSLVTHHMRDDEIVAFLRWMESHAAVGWWISDLVRSARSYRYFRLLAWIMRWHPFVKHDGPVSIRRAFREDDWLRLLAQAGIDSSQVEIRRCALGRLCVARLR